MALAGLVILAACALPAPRQITGVIKSTQEIGGDVCPLLVTTADGRQWEVTLPDGYFMDVHHAGDNPRSGLIGPDDAVIAPMGGTVTFTLTGRVPAESLCRWGAPVQASGVFVELP